MRKFLKQTDKALIPFRKVAIFIISPVFNLLARAYLGWTFLKPGMIMLQDFLYGRFDKHIYLFQTEYPVAYLPAKVAAYLALFAFTVLPVMLILGLFSRFAAAGLLVVTAIIASTYIFSVEQILWAFLGGMVFIHGGGRLAVDYYILKYLHK